jgi:TonB family protein
MQFLITELGSGLWIVELLSVGAVCTFAPGGVVSGVFLAVFLAVFHQFHIDGASGADALGSAVVGAAFCSFAVFLLWPVIVGAATLVVAVGGFFFCLWAFVSGCQYIGHIIDMVSPPAVSPRVEYHAPPPVEPAPPTPVTEYHAPIKLPIGPSYSDATAYTNASVQYRVQPTFPLVARNNGWNGRTELRVEVLTNGSVGKVEVVSSSGHSELDTASIDAVKQWRFTPAKKEGTPEASYVKIPFNFKI